MAAACAAAVTVLAACTTQSGSQPVMGPADLVAVWTSPDGGSMSFTGDHRFTVTGLRIGQFWNACARGSRLSASGTWQFLNSQGDSGPGLNGYQQGSMVDLSFTGATGAPAVGCTGGFLRFTSWNVGSAPGLCLQMDPDTPCDGYVFNRH
jgi:hypothetical protein